MTHTTKLLCLLLALSMTLPLASCGSAPEETNAGSADTQAAAETAEETEPDILAGLSYGGATFHIMTSDTDISSNYLLEGSGELTGDNVNDAVFQRNLAAEEQLDIALTYTQTNRNWGDVYKEVTQIVLSGDDTFDMIVDDQLGMSTATIDKVFVDVAALPTVDLTAAYWSEEYMYNLSIDYKSVYLMVGDYFMDVLNHSHALLYNRDMYNNLYGDPDTTIAKDFERWTQIADRTYIYDYTINFLYSAQFFSNFEYMQETMKYMHDIGITGYIYNCGDGHTAAFNELRNYLLCKLQWDVNADVEYHMMDFMNAYYGEDAAQYIKEIIDIQTAQIKATAHAFDFDWHYQSGYYPIHTMAQLDYLWAKALKADVTDEQFANVEIASLSWRFFKANQMQGEFFFLNPLRIKEQKDLYDDYKKYGINRVSSFSILPDKEDVNFIQRPINWE